MARHKIECRTKRNNLSAPPATGAAWEEEDDFGEEMEEGDGGGNSLGMANGRRSKKYIPEKLTGKNLAERTNKQI